MKPTPEQIAARLMSPAGSSALWTYPQVKALLIKAVEEERGRIEAQPAVVARVEIRQGQL